MHRKDPHYRQAKQHGYRARSAYKLLEIQKRFNIFKRAFYILDLGSAPGSWLQVAKKYAEENVEKYRDQYYHRDHFKIMGVDIKKISQIEEVKLLRMNITSAEIFSEIKRYFQDKLDLILSDVSINKTGNSFTDQLRQIKLCYKILEIVRENLKFKGSLVIKVFQGADFNKFIRDMKNEFFFVKAYKPKASKKQSNEIYLIASKKKG
ncbi:MAG: SAM-dependent methyltransferase [Candidatus Hermodarchaeota archaeon]